MEFLSQDVKNIIDEVSPVRITRQGQLWNEIEKEDLEFTKMRDNKIVSLSKEEDDHYVAAVKPLIDDYVKNMKAKNLPGEGALSSALFRGRRIIKGGGKRCRRRKDI